MQLYISAIWGVIMMFSGLLSKQLVTTRVMALLGSLGLLVVNILELSGYTIFSFRYAEA